MTDEVEHFPHEKDGKRHSKTYLIWCWLVLIGLWTLYYFSSVPFSWPAASFGFLTGVAFIVTAVELLGPDLPDWMRR